MGEFFGVNRRTVAEWAARGMPGGDRLYPLDEIARWLRATIWTNTAPPAGEDGGDSKDALEREKLQLENEARRLKLRKTAGELVSRSAAIAQVEQLFALLRARWEALPEELGAAAPPDVRADLIADWRSRIDLMHRDLEKFSLETE